MATPPTVTGIETAIHAWVRDAVAAITERVIIADQGRSRPERPYADVKLAAIQRRGIDENGAVDGNGDREVSGVRMLRVTVRTFGDEAMQMASDARDALGKETVRDALCAAGLSFWNMADALDISAEIETAIERRSTFDAFFGIASRVTENVGLIQCVEIEGEYAKPDGETIEDEFDAVCDDDLLTIDGGTVTVDGEAVTVS